MMITPRSLRLALPKRVTRITTTMKPLAMRTARTRITSTPRRKATGKPAKFIKPMTITAMALPLVKLVANWAEKRPPTQTMRTTKATETSASEDAHNDHGGQFVKGTVTTEELSRRRSCR